MREYFMMRIHDDKKLNNAGSAKTWTSFKKKEGTQDVIQIS